MARFLNDRKKVKGKSPGSLIHLGTRKIEKTRLRLIDYDEENLQELELEKIEEVLPYLSKKSVSWINIDGLHDEQVIGKLDDLFDVDSMLLEDILDTGQRPKFAETDELMLIIMKVLDYDEKKKTLISEQISFILDDSYLITIQERVGDHFDSVRERIRSSTGRVRRKKADYLMYVLLDTIVDNYLINIEQFGNIIEKTEAEIFAINNQKGLMEEVYQHKTEVNFLRKTIRPVREIVHYLLKNESGFIEPENLKYFRDLNDLITEATETIEIYQTMLSDQLNIYHASLDRRANQIMKTLTVFSAFFIPMTFVAGVYGMNFDNLPELHFKYGYLYFWILMFSIVLFLLVYFRKRKWF
jgi:magnesium transporter